MEKPISITIEEIKSSLINVLNNSGLPISIIKLIVNDLCTDVNNAAATNLRQEIDEYNKAVEEAKKSSEEAPKEETNN
jgi:uncharacterized membrane protein (DUF106 family)